MVIKGDWAELSVVRHLSPVVDKAVCRVAKDLCSVQRAVWWLVTARYLHFLSFDAPCYGSDRQKRWNYWRIFTRLLEIVGSKCNLNSRHLAFGSSSIKQKYYVRRLLVLLLFGPLSKKVDVVRRNYYNFFNKSYFLFDYNLSKTKLNCI